MPPAETVNVVRPADLLTWCLCCLPVGERSLSDLDGAQFLDASPQTHRHVGVGDGEGLPLPAAAAGSEAVR